MHFTQEDYRKIESWLYQRVVKDTELPYADPLSGIERIPIIQDGKNKTMNLNDFVKRVAEMKLPDFINITIETKKPYLTLKEAISYIPIEQRKLGLTITFHNENGNWLIYQFNGTSLNQWSSVNYWDNIIQQAIKEFILLPDEEDITGVKDGNRTFLKFKDRDYNPEEFSGMGMIILRKNLVGTEACSIDDEDHLSNILTQNMINQENTVYVVQYDFDLNGKVISIPKGCTLWFQGGSINNGTIYLQETAILGAFEFADMGTAKLFGKFNTGQVMTFSNDSYKAKEGGYFIPSTKSSSATEQEDAKNEKETFYDVNPSAYVTKVRQELRWWNGEEWILILDITDYNEIKSIINDLIEKHNAEMSACYKYFKARCYALELRMDNAENRLDNHDVIIENHETRITNNENSINEINNNIENIESNITNITNEISDITNNIEEIINNISNLGDIINNLDQTIENHIQQFIENNVIGVNSVTVNGVKYTADSNGNITLPDYPNGSSGGGGGIADGVKGTLTLQTTEGSTLGTYNGSEDKIITIPTSGTGGGNGDGNTTIVAKELLTIKQGETTLGTYDGTEPKTIIIPESTGDGTGGTGNTADKVAHKLKFTGAVTAEYDGSEEIIVDIPVGGEGSGTTPFNPKTLTFQNSKGVSLKTYNTTKDETVKLGSLILKTNGSGVTYEPFSGSDYTLDIRSLQNGTYIHPVILYSAELYRSEGSTIWKELSFMKHEGLSSVLFSVNNSVLKITLNPSNNWSLFIGSAVAVSRDMDTLTFDQANPEKYYRSNGCHMQCGKLGNTVYLHGWRTANKNNDSVYPDCLSKDGKCRAFSIVIVGYVTNNNK